MTNREKQDKVFDTIKTIFKANDWNFSGNFAFKSMNGFFYDCTFNFNPKDGRIWFSLKFKPMILDDVFWDITKLSENKEKPLSFRSNAAFKISSVQFFSSTFILENFEEDLIEIHKNIEPQVKKISEQIKTVNDFLAFLSAQDAKDYNSIISIHILNGEFDLAKQQISFCRFENISSRYEFGRKDFYDMAQKYIRRLELKSAFQWRSIFQRKKRC